MLRGFDREARDLATLQLSAVGVDLRLGLTPAALERDGDGIRVRFDDGSDDRFDAVLMATGRDPYTRGLGLRRPRSARNPTARSRSTNGHRPACRRSLRWAT
ncbi:FAD-dependent oxidoreductase [Paracoccus marcusii]|nr:FAD-dependent oxidoreductase [Paracoccus marcusii]